MGGNLERNRWLVIDDPELKAEHRQALPGRRAAVPRRQRVRPRPTGRQQRVIDSATFLVDHIAEVPAMVIAMRLDRLRDDAKNFEVAGYHGSVAPGVWSFQLAARARGLGSAWTTFHLVHEARSRSCSASPTPSPRSPCSRSPTTPATPSTPRRGARRARSPTSTAGSRPWAEADPGSPTTTLLPWRPSTTSGAWWRSTTGWPASRRSEPTAPCSRRSSTPAWSTTPSAVTPVAAFVGRPATRKIAHLRRNPTATLLWRAGWAWVAAEGTVDLFGPDDPLEGVRRRRAARAAARGVLRGGRRPARGLGRVRPGRWRRSAAWPCCSRRSRIYVNP